MEAGKYFDTLSKRYIILKNSTIQSVHLVRNASPTVTNLPLFIWVSVGHIFRYVPLLEISRLRPPYNVAHLL